MTTAEFKVNTYAYGRDTIECSGRWAEREARFEINDSSILTRLIQEAGRYCERFASDLFIDWTAVQETIEAMTDDGHEIFLFGFRRDGVDHNAFILSRAENQGYYGSLEHNYRSLWRLDITTSGRDIEMTLGRVL